MRPHMASSGNGGKKEEYGHLSWKALKRSWKKLHRRNSSSIKGTQRKVVDAFRKGIIWYILKKASDYLE